jgi:hypothetical protein
MRTAVRRILAVAVVIAVSSALSGTSHAQSIGGGGISSGNRLVATGTTSTISFSTTTTVASFDSGLGVFGSSLSGTVSSLWTRWPVMILPRLYPRPSAHAVRERSASR